MNNTNLETPEDRWTLLYNVGAAAALIAVVFFRRNCGTELVTLNGLGIWDVPATTPIYAGDWFTLLQNDLFVGLALFNLIDLINYALVGLIFLALYGALRGINKSAMVIATVFGFCGDSRLLCVEPGFLYAEPQQALCRRRNRCAASDVSGSRGSITRHR